MANKTDNRYINIYIQSGDAQKALDILLVKEKKLTEEIAKTTDPKKVQALTTELNRLSEPIDRAKKKLSGELAPTFRDLEAATRKYINEFKKTGDPVALQNFLKFNTALNQQKHILGELSDAHKSIAHESFLGSFFGNLAAGLVERATHLVEGFFENVAELTFHAEDAVIGLTNSLENAGRTDLLGKFINQSEELADKFKRLKEADITNVFTKLVDFGKLTESQIKETTEVIINYAAKQKISLTDAADVITKGFTGTVRGLKTYGISLKDAGTFQERYNIIVGQLGAKLQGAELAFAQSARGGLQSWSQSLNRGKEKIGEFFLSLVGLEKQQIKNAIQAKHDADQGTILVARYEALAKQTNKTAAEKSELESITRSLATTFGTSVVEINKETGAMTLNVEATKSLIKQKLLLANNKAAELAAKLNAAEEKEAEVKERLNITTDLQIAKEKELGKTFAEVEHMMFSEGSKAARTVIENKELNTLFNLGTAAHSAKREIGFLGDDIKSLTSDLEELGFKKGDVDKLFKPGDPTKPVGTGLGSGDTDTSKFNALLQKADAFNKKLRDLQQQSADASKTQNQKEIDDAKHKYDEILIEYLKLQKEFAGHGIKLLFTEEDINNLENKELAGIIARQQKELEEKYKKEFIASATSEYQEALRLSAAYYENQKQLRAKAFVAGKIDEKQYKADVAAIDAAASQNLLQIAQDYANNKITITVDGVEKEVAVVKQADEDLTKFQKENLDKQTADILAAYAQREQNRKLLVELEKESLLSTARARVALSRSGSEEEFKAKKNLAKLEHKIEIDEIEEKRKAAIVALQSQFDAELKLLIEQLEIKRKIELALIDPNDPDAAEKRAGINNRFDNAKNVAEINAAKTKADTLLKINNDFNALISAANSIFRKKEMTAGQQHAIDVANQIIAGAQQVLNVLQTFDQIKTDKENAELDRDKKLNDKKKANLDSRLKAGTISQLQYNREIDKMDRNLRAKQHKAEVDQFRRQQKQSIIQAIINGALGITKTSADLGFPAAIPFIIAQGIITGVQIATISQQKPPALARGGKLDGRYHSEGGNPVLDGNTGQKIAEIEKGEGVVNKTTMADKTNYNISGTASQIISWLNAKHGGVHWEVGATMQPRWMNAKLPAFNLPVLKQYYALGGQFRSNVSSSSNSEQLASQNANNEMMKLLAASILRMDTTIGEMQGTISNMNATLGKGIKAYTLITENEKQQGRLDAIRNAATVTL